MSKKLNVDDLVEKGLVKKKPMTHGLYLLQYHNKVFYDQLWNSDPRLLFCRGTVVDEDDNVIVHAMKKEFNPSEVKYEFQFGKDYVIAPKVNGFMINITRYKGELIYSSTGSMVSSHCELARKVIEASDYDLEHVMGSGETFTFEICTNTDPHIVEEEEGAYLIAITINGQRQDEWCVDEVAHFNGFKRKFSTRITLTRQSLQELRDSKTEGFMLYPVEGITQQFDNAIKLKSDYYLSKKAFARMGKKSINTLFDHTDKFLLFVPYKYHYVFDVVVKSWDKEGLMALTEHSRKTLFDMLVSQKDGLRD